MNPLVSLTDVHRSYGSPPVQACAGITLDIYDGELVAIVGPSGSGKSTLLNLVGTLDKPTCGIARIDGIDVNELDDRSLSALRAHRIGFVFQQFHLAEGTTTVDNVADGLLYVGVPLTERRRRALVALKRVGLGHRLDHRPHQLSGGERQRVAIARAVVGEPPLLLADEPTGNLDSASGAAIVGLLHELNQQGTTVVVITHDSDLAAEFPRRIAIRDGRILSDDRKELAS
ncbi:putative ABC transporter ATP-binding protein [Rhodococcus wratislaviensis NBRC 100605]|uniref:Putative ABC transporter ATP-binding protein n=1 Tax=Rhodococcus wratislaviensis NBRC 100605 TaxID=1219028 RepID=X0Q9H7_RHOWR|nr:putative ABC transporter ATP-binding protein [Rhodococcus wratislaviensis NBRC 100605]